MPITNKWLTPYQRSYQQIKSKLLDNLKDIRDKNGNQLITDYSEGNIFIILISIFSAIAEVIHYYIDNMSRETFFSTARKYESLIKHSYLVDYPVKGAIASTVDVLISRPLTSEYISAELVVTKGLQFNDNLGNVWEVVKDTKWASGVTGVSVPLIQHILYSDDSMVGYVIPNKLPVSNKVVIQLTNPGDGTYYENGTMQLSIAGESWVLVDTFAFSSPSDKHFKVIVTTDQKINIVFGDGVHGKIPDPGYKITTCKYYVTKGVNGNIGIGQINDVPFTISSVVLDAVCTNPYQSGGGSNYEDFNSLREHVPLHVRTLGVAITKQDFIDIAKQVDGVNKCAAEYECGRKLNLYISPDAGTIASSTLCNSVLNQLKSRAPLTTWLKVYPAGVTDICLDINVTGKKSYSSDEIYSNIVNALKDKYSVENTEIGGSVRLSDIYALIDNLPMVDYLHINKFYVKPWPTTIYGNSSLIIGTFLITKVTGSMKYLITFSSSTNYQIRSVDNGYTQNGVVGDTVEVNDEANGNQFSISITSNSYSSNSQYSILISEPNSDYIEPGFNLPIFIDDTNLKLNINEVL